MGRYLIQLKELLGKIEPPKKGDLERVESVSRVVKYPKGKQLYVLGDGPLKEGFLLKGCLRIFSRNEQGKECNNSFVGENEFFGGINIPSPEASCGIEALSDCEILMFADRMLDCGPYLVRVRNRLMEQSFLYAQQRVSSLLLENPEQRYRHFMQTHSRLLQYIPDYYIASYIGVSSVHLSRIKKTVLS